MPETLSHSRVGAHVSRSLSPDGIIKAEPTIPAALNLRERIRLIFKNPLVLVGITWMVMAVLLARELLVR